MKTKRIFSVIGLTLLVLSQPTWAAGHGGGGGGFGGGIGFHGGGRGGLGGAPHFAGRPARFGGGGPRFAGGPGMSPMRPHVSSRPNLGINRPAAASVARNRGAMPSAMRSSQAFSQRGLNGRTNHIAERHEASWHGDWDRRHAHFDHNRFFIFIGGFWCGLDSGFFPWDYLPYSSADYYPYDYYPDAQSYDNTQPYDNTQLYDNTGPVNNGVPAADPAVEAAQTELAQLGYYTGPVDGVFGPTTRDAVANYQIDNQLNVTGSLSPDTLQSLGLPQEDKETGQ